MVIELSPLSFDASNMTSIVDSTAHFAQRASEVGLSNAALGSLVRNGSIRWANLPSPMDSQGCRLRPLHFMPMHKACWGP